MKKFEEILRKQNISEDKIGLMREYACFLAEENKKYNLTRIVEPEEMANRHFLDSVVAEQYIPAGASVIDIGTGGGFPGIPLKIVRPDISLTLVDSSHKKIEFVQNGAEKIGLSVTALAKRAEELTTFRGQFDIVVSRAMAALNVLIEICIPLLKVGGTLLAYKGEDAVLEVEAAKRAMEILHCSYEIHNAGIQGRNHVILEIKKNKKTPEAYPRRFSKIKSSPL